MKYTKQYIAVIPRKGLGKLSPAVQVVCIVFIVADDIVQH